MRTSGAEVLAVEARFDAALKRRSSTLPLSSASGLVLSSLFDGGFVMAFHESSLIEKKGP
jgi:hypothetical protein